MEPVKILSEDEFNSSTVTMASDLNTNINVYDVANYIPITHIYNMKNERIHLNSGTRNSINYFGYEGIIITSCYKSIRRGVRIGIMNNMMCIDLQLEGRNVHIKLSKNTITSVGTCEIQKGVNAYKMVVSHINNLKYNINRFQNNKDKEYIYKWILKNFIKDGQLVRTKDAIESELYKDEIKFLSVYLDDFEPDQLQEYMDKIKRIETLPPLFEGILENINTKVYNSVYHINICQERLSLHILAPYLAEKGILVEFHNWTSEGVNICFPIEQEVKSDYNFPKDYKHRFTIHEKSSMRQCSPGFKEESYRYYKGVIKLIKEFIENGQVFDGYKKYIIEEDLNDLDDLNI